VKLAAFAHCHRESAGEQADASSEDVQNQERESHATTSFEPRRLLPRPEQAAIGILSNRWRSICRSPPVTRLSRV